MDTKYKSPMAIKPEGWEDRVWSDISGRKTTSLQYTDDKPLAKESRNSRTLDLALILVIFFLGILAIALICLVGYALKNASAQTILTTTTISTAVSSTTIATTLPPTTLVKMSIAPDPVELLVNIKNIVKPTTSTSTTTTIGSTTTTTRPRYGPGSVPICNNKLHPEWKPGVDCKYGEVACISTGDSCGGSHGTWNCEYRY
jgi:hypothetical protein